MSSGLEWVVSPEIAFGRLFRRQAAGIQAVASREAIAMAQQIEDWMMENAPWRDITGTARQELQATASSDANGSVITLSHGVWYGIYLETKYAGRDAILSPAVDYWAPKFIGKIRADLGV